MCQRVLCRGRDGKGACSLLMVRLKWRRKEGEVQSCFFGDSSFNSDSGITSGTVEAWGFISRNSADRFLDS